MMLQNADLSYTIVPAPFGIESNTGHIPPHHSVVSLELEIREHHSRITVFSASSDWRLEIGDYKYNYKYTPILPRRLKARA